MCVVEPYIPDRLAGIVLDLDARLLGHGREILRAHVHGDIRVAVLQRQSLRAGGLGPLDDHAAYVLALPTAPVTGVRIEHHALVVCPLGHHPGARAGVVLVEPLRGPGVALGGVLLDGCGAYDARALQRRERCKEAWERRLEM